MAAALLLLCGCGEMPPPTVPVLARDFRFAPAVLDLARQRPVQLTLRSTLKVKHDYQTPRSTVFLATSTLRSAGRSTSLVAQTTWRTGTTAWP